MRTLGVAGLMGCLSLLHARAAPAERLQACSIVSIGIDSTHAYTGGSASAILGEAIGETFVADDTLIQSVTVWRPALQDTNYAPMKFWITTVDTLTGAPQPSSTILSGDTLIVPFGDHVHATAIRYSFSPPLALPHRGQYFFAVQNTCAGYFDLLYDVSDDYPLGKAWRTSRSNFSGCGLAGALELGGDLIFTIEFCGTSTPVLRRTWGDLKARYH